MARKTATKTGRRFWQRHHHLKHFLIGTAAVVLIIIGLTLLGDVRTARRQTHLQPFYDTAGLSLKGVPGQIVRQEPLGVDVEGGKALRVLYRTQRADGSPTFSSGMIFISDNSAAGTPRPVVAWAHGTLGLGDACAPSRTPDPVRSIAWVSSMLQKGWVVTATDYAGFGTPGTQGYLVGGDEAHDVLNSVRAVRDLPAAEAGTNFVIWGHSQGGNSALFSAHDAAAYAPELHLLGTTASAPAAELVPLLQGQYGTAVDWVIGPLIMTSWPATNKALSPDILTAQGKDNYQRIADQCIVKSTIGGLFRTVLKQKFFAKNPNEVPAWRDMATAQSAPLPGTGQPLLVVESKTDKVVLPNTTALYITQACAADSSVDTLWLEKANHQDIPDDSSEQVISWLSDRIAGKPVDSDCAQQLPVRPAAPARP
jgi:alpha-beta hydrolase superfamily lysophospholipase